MKTNLLFMLPLAGLLMAASCTKSDSKTAAPSPQPLLGIPVKNTSATIALAWKPATNANPGCFIDLDSAVAYTVTTAKAHGPEIDLCWSGRPTYGDANLASPDENVTSGGTMEYVRDLHINTWTQQNHTVIERSDKITATDFDGVQFVSQLQAQWKRDEAYLTYVPFVASTADLSCIYVFETAQHKRGLIKVTKALYGANGYAEMQIKIAP